VVDGDLPQTDTLGFRWSAVNNLLLTAGDLGADEWRASRSADEENAEREMRQFVWCLPAQALKWQQISLEAQEIVGRTCDLPRGILPGDTQFLTAAMDLGKYLTHWIVVAWREGAIGHIVDYGRIEVASADIGVEQALLLAMRQFQEMCTAGWPRYGMTETKAPEIAFIDAGYMAPVVYAFCREAGRRYLPSVGRGAAQQRAQWYNRPTQTGSIVKHIGEGCHLNDLKTEHLMLAEVDADHWKTWVHERLKTPMASPGAILLYRGTSQEHLSLARHLTAERKVEEFIAGKGLVVRWERVQKNNHWFDALYNACAAGHLAGVRLIAPPKPMSHPAAALPPPPSRIDMSRWHGIRRSR